MTHNGKEYEDYGVSYGDTIEECVVEIISKSIKSHRLYFMKFNDHIFFSDEVSLDSAYKECLGMTFEEYKESQRKMRERIKKENEEFKAKIPELIKEYEEEGLKIVGEKYIDHLKEIIPLSLNGWYKGWELKHAFELIQMLNNGKSFEEIDQKIYDQNHSGMSCSITVQITCELCDKGSEFLKWFKEKHNYKKEEEVTYETNN